MRRLAIRAAVCVGAIAVWAVPAATASASASSGIVNLPRHSVGGTSNVGWASSNWSGYAATGGPFTAATGQWTVPSVAATSKSTYSSSWVGIDGFNNSSLIQTGTEQDYYSGSAHYAAWWEILPAAETVIPSINVSPGDHMTASIQQVSAGVFTITLTDNTKGQTFSTTQAYNGALTSVEWIQEAPTVFGHVATLAHYSSPVTFDPGTANGGNPGLNASESGEMIQQNRIVSIPSTPDGDTDGFNVSYGSTAPPPPGS